MISQLRVAFGKVPDCFHVRHQLKHRLHGLVDRRAIGARTDLRVNTPLQVTRTEHRGRHRTLAGYHRGQCQNGKRGIPRHRALNQAVIGTHPHVLDVLQRLGAETVAPNNGRDAAQHLYEMRKLLSGPIRRQDQVPAKQVSLVTDFLQLVAGSGEPQPDLGAHLIAWCAHAGRRRYIGPGG